ncbi:hypothetical protein SAMN04488113_11812 [Alkalibacterium gilvum]|uniref:Uncharacterized protein n=1 Tax=Alkalibacterium gilvum TaxID=1130080 RepID=A0A1H6TKR8_9LACT|nr:hypothetical protein SAMN04488113_11812 [Alkalibacterium gilvum]
MRFINSIYFYITLNFINTFLRGTNFFRLKRLLLNSIGIKVGVNS